MGTLNVGDAALVWFRRDLRLNDHSALFHALQRHSRVYCGFVFDTDILDELPSRADRRLSFIHASLVELDAALGQHGSRLIVRHGAARREIVALAEALGVSAVYANRDYEPAARHRDAEVKERLKGAGITFLDYKDQVIFEQNEVLSQAGRPYGVFTPYKNAWLRQLTRLDLQSFPLRDHFHNLAPLRDGGVPDLKALGFVPAPLPPRMQAGMSGAEAAWADFLPRMTRYKEHRDFPALKGVSYLSVHLRFGTLSIRELARTAWEMGGRGAEAWLSELIWRDFYQMILWHHPQVADQAYKPEMAGVPWVAAGDAPQAWSAWCEGRTGYPLVDAAMRQLRQSGWMHNRLRMLTASFLTKDLGIDWRDGERFFAHHLLDFDLAANNGGWQWAASTGCDAQPWFRIFNPITQSEKFDPMGDFIRRYVPELAGFSAPHIHAPWRASTLEQQAAACIVGRDYPAPIVDHALARLETLQRFKVLKA